MVDVDDRHKPTPDWERPPEPAIHRAARKGDLGRLEELLAGGANINERADLEYDNGPHLKGLTTLMVAARSIDGASVETLRWLVEHGADIHARSEGDDTAAWYAAGHGGRWEFHTQAVTPGHVDRLRYLLDLGLDPQECNFIGRSLLTEACEAGDPERVRLLLDRGAGVEPKSTPRGEKAGQDGMIAMLNRLGMESGEDVPRGEFSSFQIPLFCAARSGSAACVRLLLEAGANVHERDESGGTALMVAGSAEVVRVLLDAGADLHAVNEFDADALASVLDGGCCCGACGLERFDVARALIEVGADIERVGKYGKARLASAAFAHNADAVEFLLGQGANVHRRDSGGGTSLHAICWQGEYSEAEVNQACERIIRTLVSAGVSVHETDGGGATALHEAAEGDWGNQTAIRVLLELGAEVDARDEQGRTALMLAADHGEVMCVRLLLEAGSDPLAHDLCGMGAIDRAKRHLASWEEIDAAGPEFPLYQMMADLKLSVLEDMGNPGEVADALRSRQDGGCHQAQALRDARTALQLLEDAAKRRE